MSIDGKSHREDGVRDVTTSQASKRDASGVFFESKYESAYEEREAVRQEVVVLRTQLMAYHKSEYQKAQARIRKGGDSPETLRQWLSTKAKMDKERQAILRKISEKDLRIQQLGPRCSIERAQLEQAEESAGELYRTDGSFNLPVAFKRIMSAVEEINGHIRELREGRNV